GAGVPAGPGPDPAKCRQVHGGPWRRLPPRRPGHRGRLARGRHAPPGENNSEIVPPIINRHVELRKRSVSEQKSRSGFAPKLEQRCGKPASHFHDLGEAAKPISEAHRPKHLGGRFAARCPLYPCHDRPVNGYRLRTKEAATRTAAMRLEASAR